MSREDLILVPMNKSYLEKGICLSKRNQVHVPMRIIRIGSRRLNTYSILGSPESTASKEDYYVPEYSHDATFDSFLHTESHTYVLQTSTSTSLEIKSEELTDSLKRNKAPNSSNHLHFVFAISAHQTFSVTYVQDFEDVDFYTIGVFVDEQFRRTYLESDSPDVQMTNAP